MWIFLLCAKQNPRLNLAYEIAEQNKFMHWELEFADLFKERGGFDLILGNPPWVKLEWSEQNAISDKHPLFVVKNWSAKETADHRSDALKDNATYKIYFQEYESMSGELAFLNALQNYEDLRGQQTNLFKCFLPQAWMIGNQRGISAFVHPNGVFDDPKGDYLREKLYPHLRKHFRFENELKLFREVGNAMKYSLNIYGNEPTKTFEVIFNLFSPSTVDECFDQSISGTVPGIKDSNDNWNTHGHPARVLNVSSKELKLFSTIFSGGEDWRTARLPILHARQLVEVLEKFADAESKIGDLGQEVFSTAFWDETNGQTDGTILRDVHFPESDKDAILSGPHIGVANPLFQSSQRNCSTHRAFDNIDLSAIPDDYLQRCNYRPAGSISTYTSRIPQTQWGTKFTDEYRIVLRKMMNQSGERTLVPTIIPPNIAFINGIFGFAVHNTMLLPIAGSMASLVYDFYIKAAGKANCRYDTVAFMPLIQNKVFVELIKDRAALLNCVSNKYQKLLEQADFHFSTSDEWAKSDVRLDGSKFKQLKNGWTYSLPLRSDYARRQALVELDVLTAMSLNMTLNQLCTIYRIQFPVLQQYEADTWYDTNGRIVFTNNRSMSGVGFDRKEWENGIKDAPTGQKFYRTITDDTMPGGPIERTIEYVAPFDRCDREKDYETAWEFFEKKYGKTN